MFRAKFSGNFGINFGLFDLSVENDLGLNSGTMELRAAIGEKPASRKQSSAQGKRDDRLDAVKDICTRPFCRPGISELTSYWFAGRLFERNEFAVKVADWSGGS